MDLLGNLVDVLQDASLQANPGHRQRYQQALHRHAHGGIMPDPDLNTDSDDDDTPRVKIPPPIFKGIPGERPDAHIYATEDWMEAMCFREDQYIDKFKHTLNHLAQEWYHSLDRDTFHGDWEEFTKHFSRYFSTQGRNIKHLHERWRAFSFDPVNDDIEEYIRDVKEAAKQLGHGDNAMVNLLKATMLTELYGTLYGHNNLPLLCTMLKDIYAKKPQPATAKSTTTTPGATDPFTLLRTPLRTPIKHTEDPSLEEKVNHLTEALYQMDLEGKPAKKPFKPFLTQPRRRFKGNFDKGCNRQNGCFRGFNSNRRDRRGRFGNRGAFKPRRPFGKFDKSPNTKHSRVSVRPINKDKSKCFKCKEFGHFQDECPTNKSS